MNKLVALALTGALTLSLGTGCRKKGLPTGLDVAAATAPLEALAVLRARELPNPLQGRFGIKLRSKPLGIAGTTIGGLVTDAPGRAYLGILTPIGTPVFTVTADGERVALMDTQNKEYITGEGSQMSFGTGEGDTVTVDDMVALLLGRVDVSPDAVQSTASHPDLTMGITASGPGKTTLDLVLHEANATPASITVRDAEGAVAVSAAYEPFQLVEEVWLPTVVHLEAPAVDLTIDVRFKSWKTLEQAPDVFGIATPKGYTNVSLADYVERMKASVPVEGAEGQDSAAEPTP